MHLNNTLLASVNTQSTTRERTPCGVSTVKEQKGKDERIPLIFTLCILTDSLAKTKRSVTKEDYDKKWKFYIAPYMPPDFDQVKRRLS